MLGTITIEGFKNVRAIDLELAPLVVLIGPNNSGKSNFLQALALCSALNHAQGDAELARHLVPFGGADVLDWRAPHRELQLGIRTTDLQPRAWSIRMHVPTRPEEYPYVLEEHYEDPDEGALLHVYRREREEGVFDGETTRVPGRYSTASALGTGGVVLPRSIEGTPRDVRLAAFGHLPRGRVWQMADIPLGRASLSSGVADSDGFLAPDGSDLVNVVRFWEQSPEGLRVLTDHLNPLLSKGLGSVERIYTEERGGHRWINIKTTKRTLRLDQLSHGSSRLLSLALLLFSEIPVTWVGLDEPELNLHPAWARTVGRWLQEASSHRQVLASTHSPEILDSLTPGFRVGDVSVLVFGEQSVRRVLPETVSDALDEGWELGDLYRVGDRSLGGWSP